MRIISKKTLCDYWEKHPSVRSALEAWHADAKKSHWKSPSEIKRRYRNASIIADNRVVFNIKGNDYRLVVAVNYPLEIIYIKFIGTHKEYDRINAKIIGRGVL